MKWLMEWVPGLSHRLGWAVAVALLVLNLWVLPLGLNQELLRPILSLLNAPVSILSLVLPCPERPMDFPFGNCEHWGYQSAWDTFANHLRFAIPVYMLCFYVPEIIRAGLKALRTRRSLPGSNASDNTRHE